MLLLPPSLTSRCPTGLVVEVVVKEPPENVTDQKLYSADIVTSLTLTRFYNVLLPLASRFLARIGFVRAYVPRARQSAGLPRAPVAS